MLPRALPHTCSLLWPDSTPWEALKNRGGPPNQPQCTSVGADGKTRDPRVPRTPRAQQQGRRQGRAWPRPPSTQFWGTGPARRLAEARQVEATPLGKRSVSP